MYWRELDTGRRGAAFNMALDDVLLKAHSHFHTPTTLRFLSFSPACVLVGYSQVVEQEVRTSYCKERGIDINRRITGGGAIYFDPSQLGWEIIGPRELFPLKLEKLYERIGKAVALGLRRLGLAAKYKPRNDIEVKGRKISGMGGTEYRGSFLFQGTLLVRDEIEEMVRSLKIPVEKLTQRELGSIRERVTCIERELGYVPEREELKRAIGEGFRELFGVELRRGELIQKEKEMLEKRLRFFSSPEWVYRVRYPLNTQGVLQTAYRCKGGVIRLAMVVNEKEKRVRATYISGDFFIEPKERIFDLERLLKNIPMRRDYLFSQVRSFFSQNSLRMLGITLKDFLKAFDDIFTKWGHLDYGFTIDEADRLMVVGEGIERVLELKPTHFLFPYCAKKPECPLRYNEECDICGECEVGEGYLLAMEKGLTPITINSFEHLWQTLLRFKSMGVKSYIGSCCQKFYTKHREDFEKSKIPAILIDIESETCYDLGRAKDAYRGRFKNKTDLNIPLIRKVLSLIGGMDGRESRIYTHKSCRSPNLRI